MQHAKGSQVGTVVVAAVVHGNHARCTQQRVLTAAMRPRYPSSREAISPYTVVTATRLKVLVKKFNRKVQQDGILSEARRRAHYESPQARRKRKAAAQRRKQRRTRQPG